MFKRPALVVQFLSLALFFGTVATASAAEDELLWRGDHATARTIMDELAKEYAKEKKGKITLQPFSTVSGLDAVAQGTADIAGSARPKYTKRPEEAGINFVPVALDAAVLIAYPKNPVQSLTLHQVFDLYYGRITNWSAVGGEPKDVNLYGIAAPLDGVEFSVRDLVFRNGDQRVAIPRLYLNTTKLEEGVSIDPAGIGLSTLASIHSNPAVKALAIEGISATPATIADGSYPLYITLYLAAKADSPKQAAIDRFIAFLELRHRQGGAAQARSRALQRCDRCDRAQRDAHGVHRRAPESRRDDRRGRRRRRDAGTGRRRDAAAGARRRAARDARIEDARRADLRKRDAGPREPRARRSRQAGKEGSRSRERREKRQASRDRDQRTGAQERAKAAREEESRRRQDRETGEEGRAEGDLRQRRRRGNDGREAGLVRRRQRGHEVLDRSDQELTARRRERRAHPCDFARPGRHAVAG